MLKIKLLFLFLFFSTIIQAQSIPQLQRLANQGNAEAQFLLAQHFAKGIDVEKDYEKTFHWFQQASNQGHTMATNYLGLCYCKGIGTEKNFEEAFRLFQMAANKNNSDAQYNLGYCYYYGEGTPTNYNEAVRWFEKAALKQHYEAMNKLGECYKNGQGVEQNHKKAINYFQIAAKEQNIAGQYNLGLLYYLGEGVEQNYQTAAEWFSRASVNNSGRNGHPWAQYYLGLCYKNGQGVEQNYKEAAKNFSFSATQQYKLAQIELAHCYERGLGVEQSYKTAYAWLLKCDSTEANLHYGNFERFTNFFVENETAKMLAKLESETDSAHQQRLSLLQNDTTILAQLRPKSAEKYLEVKQDYFVYEPLTLVAYDSLAQQFAFTSPQAGEQLLNVAPELADSFAAQFSKMRQTPVFVLENGKVAIQNFKLYWQFTNLTYQTARKPQELIETKKEDEEINDNESADQSEE